MYTMSRAQICACTKICILRMYIIEPVCEIVSPDESTTEAMLVIVDKGKVVKKVSHERLTFFCWAK